MPVSRFERNIRLGLSAAALVATLTGCFRGKDSNSSSDFEGATATASTNIPDEENLNASLPHSVQSPEMIPTPEQHQWHSVSFFDMDFNFMRHTPEGTNWQELKEEYSRLYEATGIASYLNEVLLHRQIPETDIRFQVRWQSVEAEDTSELIGVLASEHPEAKTLTGALQYFLSIQLYSNPKLGEGQSEVFLNISQRQDGTYSYSILEPSSAVGSDHHILIEESGLNSDALTAWIEFLAQGYGSGISVNWYGEMNNVDFDAYSILGVPYNPEVPEIATLPDLRLLYMGPEYTNE